MLTRRQFEVYMLIVTRALSERQIARTLDISTETVMAHVREIMNKMGMSTKVELLVQYQHREAHGGIAGTVIFKGHGDALKERRRHHGTQCPRL